MVAWSALVGSGRVWAPATLSHCKSVDLAPLEGLVVAWSALVGSGRVWAPATLSHCKSQ